MKDALTADQETSKLIGELTGTIKALKEQQETAKGEQKAWAEAREKEIRELKDTLEAQRKENAETIRKFSLSGLKEEEASLGKKFSVAQAAMAWHTGNWNDAGFEKEAINAVHKQLNRGIIGKDILAGTGSAGGFTLPIQVADDIIPLAIAQTPVLNNMGIRKMTNLGVGEYRLPKQTARATAYWVGEASAPASSSAAFDVRILRPKKLAAVSFISNDVYRQGRSDLEQILRQDIADAFALAMETALIVGKGSEFQPKGLMDPNTNAANYAFTTVTGAGVTNGAIGTNGGIFGPTQAASMVNSIRKANLLKGNLGYLFHPDVLYGLQILRAQFYSGQTKNGLPLVPGSPLLTDEEVQKLLRGFKFGTTTLMPAALSKGTGTSLAGTIFGDWSQVVLGLWSGLEIMTSNQAVVNGVSAFAQDGMFIRGIQQMDITVRDEAALCVLSDCQTTSLSEFT